MYAGGQLATWFEHNKSRVGFQSFVQERQPLKKARRSAVLYLPHGPFGMMAD